MLGWRRGFKKVGSGASHELSGQRLDSLDWKVRSRLGVTAVTGDRYIRRTAELTTPRGVSTSAECGTQVVRLCGAEVGTDRLALVASAKGLCG